VVRMLSRSACACLAEVMRMFVVVPMFVVRMLSRSRAHVEEEWGSYLDPR